MSNINSINQLKCCPFCGNDQYYQHMYVQGSGIYYSCFDNSDNADNTEMYSGLVHTMGVKIYCNNCEEYLGNLNTGKLSVSLKQLIKSGKAILKPIEM